MELKGEWVERTGLELAPQPGTKSHLQIKDADPTSVATVIGSGIGAITTLEASHAPLRKTRLKNKIKRFSLPMLIPNAAAGQVAIRFGARGECSALSTRNDEPQRASRPFDRERDGFVLGEGAAAGLQQPLRLHSGDRVEVDDRPRRYQADACLVLGRI